MGTELAVCDPFGRLGVLARMAHGDYVDGLVGRAVDACHGWQVLARAAGDATSERYLLYVQAISLLDLGRYSESLEVATTLLERMGEEPEPVWRCKALSVAAEATIRMDKVGAAIAPLAEADWLLRSIEPGSYGHMSASMALALALRSANLVERADEILGSLSGGGDPELEMLLAQEAALLSAHWATVLLLIDRTADAAVQLHETAVRGVRTQHWAREAGHTGMAARGELIEAYAVAHLGEPALAVSRARAASGVVDARAEMMETHMLHLVLGSPSAGPDLAAAYDHLAQLLDEATACRRGIWVAAGRAAAADLDAAEHGESAGARMWREVARTALRGAWAEREARFAALRDQESIRALTAKADSYGRVILEDPLTGLGNRRMLTRLVGAEEPWAAVFVDVDSFKEVNDTHSHAIGDIVLRTIADLLRSVTRAEDRLLRYGGDEFVVLTAHDVVVADGIAHRVRDAVAAYPWASVAPGLAVTVSVGVGLTTPTPGSDLLEVADRALLAAKRSGRNRVVRAGA